MQGTNHEFCVPLALESVVLSWKGLYFLPGSVLNVDLAGLLHFMVPRGNKIGGREKRLRVGRTKSGSGGCERATHVLSY